MPFSQETLDFLVQNHLNDSRAWFREHAAQYRQFVIRPFQELVTALTPAALEIDPQFVTAPRIDKTICRIWRDTRFSNDPSLYRDTMWLIFKRSKMHSTQFPGLYFEVGPQGFSYGGGFYHASTSYMNTLRRLILAGDPAFLAALDAYEGSKFEIHGDCYRRPRYPDRPEPLRRWLERRNIGFEADSADFDLLYSDRLGEVLSKELLRFAPIYRFLLKAALLELSAGKAPEEELF